MTAPSIDGIHPDRITVLNNNPVFEGNSDKAPRFVLYWMQRAQRSYDNHALEYAVAWANALSLPLVVAFGLTPGYPEANLRHYAFLIEGLADVKKGLAQRGIPFFVAWGNPPEIALHFADAAALIVTDGAYLRHLREWRAQVAREAPCRVDLVETDLVVPVRVASDHREYAARTIRKKVMNRLEEYAHLPATQSVALPAMGVEKKSSAPENPLGNLSKNLELIDSLELGALKSALDVDTSVAPVPDWFRGGQEEAKRRFRRFLTERFEVYDENRNHPAGSDSSGMSPYLHFGHVSPVWLVVAAEEVRSQAGSENVETFVEELVVRRELAYNYCYFEPEYASYQSLPDWARETLADHKSDERPVVYDEKTLEAAETHDDYWNAAMLEMRLTGSMHNYMRMYWGKKILEWSKDPEEAFDITLRLNNKYFLDGRDANSYANVGWIFGLHDRPWPEREIYGKVRTMTASGLERKTDINFYVLKVRRLTRG